MKSFVALQMDALSSLDPKWSPPWNNSLALGEGAQKRGFCLFCYEPQNLSLENGRVTARGAFVELNLQSQDFYKIVSTEEVDLGNAKAVLIRQDPPFDMAYMTSCYILEHLPPSVPVLNPARAIRDFPEKLSATHFPEIMAETLVTSSVEKAREFHARHKNIVVKPLYLMAGKEIIRAREGDSLARMEEKFKESAEPLMLQRFLPEIKNGDKRIVILDGEPIGAFVRQVRPGNEWTVGQEMAFEAASEITARDRDICATLRPAIQGAGLFLVGLDVIGDYVTEVNVTSPAGLRELERHNGIPATDMFWDLAAKKYGIKA